MGFCMGGALTFASLATIPGFKAGGVFYGIPDLNTFKV
jgi:dienelactone hydrolase